MRKKTGKDIICVVCGAVFYRPACHIKNDTKYCTRKCFFLGRPRQTNSGKTHFHKGMVPWNKGVKGYMGGNETSFKKGQSAWNKGLGMATEDQRLRWSDAYKAWRKAVFERDNYTCQFCAKRGQKLNADHIKPFAIYPELRLDINNGRTLCIGCHKTTYTYARCLIRKQKSLLP